MALHTCHDILAFWFPNKEFQDFWFSNTADHEIKIKFGDLLDRAEKGELTDWLDSSDSAIAYIILLDQFTRNINRAGDFRKNDAVTLKVALEIITTNKYTYPIHQRIFLYLPLRHQHMTCYLDLVMAHILMWEKDTVDPIELNIIKRFKTATIRDYSKTTDTIKTITSEHHMFSNVGYVIDDICAEYAEINSGLLSVKRSDTFARITENSTYITTREFITKNFGESASICISLSGGVDSMWLSLLLKVMEFNSHISQVVAVHVDYANRKESNDEASFVINWAQFLGIPICYRRIDHIKRGCIDTSLYEAETKKIRFGLYRYVMDEYNVRGVILGHHRGDIDENIVMNILRSGHDLLGLSGMTDIQNIDGVNICRPLLPHPKSDIYDGAHTYQVPYLKDTTSESCYRGFVRKTLIPSIENKDSAALGSIRAAGKMSDEWRDVINKKIFKPMIDAIVDYKYGMTIPYDVDNADLPGAFWSNYFVAIFHKRNIRMCSVRNIKLFMNWFKKGCNGMFLFSNGMVTFINTSKTLMYIMKHALIYRIDRRDKIELPEPGTGFEINGWKMKITEVVDVISDTIHPVSIVTGCSDTIHPVTIENIMSGSYCFYLHQVADVDNFQMTYGKKKDRNLRKYFRGCDMLKFVPKIKVDISNGSHRVFRIDVSF